MIWSTTYEIGLGRLELEGTLPQRYLFIWMDSSTKYNQYNNVEKYDYRGVEIMVWAEIYLGGYTDLHGSCMWGEVLDRYIHPYATAIGNEFILMDDNVRKNPSWAC
ncbi:uncharacterized protein TNCV_3810811 [Trichonephila clavipes]|nr:uncharacterized protein TNCV_3810811 [Trichonephila clavipes]